MATAVSHQMSLHPFNNSNQCEPDIEEWFNFNETPSNNGASSSRMASTSAPSALTSPATTIAGYDGGDESQTFSKPSFPYEQYKQQTGLPSNSIPGLMQDSSFSNTGLGDMNWSSGMGGLDGDYSMESDFSNGLPAFFYPNGESSQQDGFVDPSNITQPEETPNVRAWPGMHQQQALAKAQAHAQQQREQQMMQQKRAAMEAQQRSRSQTSRRSASHQPTDARTEETIARVVNQIRQNSQMASQQDGSSPNGLPHIVRMKKDEEDMDEDERLLASEEGKKLSSKERRQLRNKVSARAFRSRRKEYIGQLEGEVAAKVQEANDLRVQNRALMEENVRSRAFIEKLLRHQAFAPFLEDLSRDESIQTRLPVQSNSNPSPPAPKDVNPFPAPQQFQNTPMNNPQIGMALVPETPVDLSMLSLNNNWGAQTGGFNFNQPQVFAVLEVPEGPANPINTDVLAGKGYAAFDEHETVEDLKADHPVIESPKDTCVKPAKVAETEEDLAFDNNPDFCLFHDSAPSPPSSPASFDVSPERIALPEKTSQFELVSSSSSSESAMERVERICLSMEPAYQRLLALTAELEE